MLLTAFEARSDEELLWLLRYRTRRKIILAIGDAGRISATALREALGISTGSLYYNLRQLRGFVTQDEEKNYVLTEGGLRVYKALKEKGTISSSDLAEYKAPGKLVSILTNIFFPLWLYTPIYERAVVAMILPATSFILSTIFLIYSRHAPLLLHFYRTSPSPIIILCYHLLNILILYGLATLISILISGALFRAEGKPLSERVRSVAWSSIRDELRFISSLVVALLPLIFYPTILSLDKLFGLGLIPRPGTPIYYQVKDAFLIIAQGMTLPFLTALIAYGRRLSGATAALVTLLIFFISHTIYQMLAVGAIT